MKTKFLAFICLLLGVAYGCSDDDNNKTPGFLNDAVIEAFNKDFPTATNFDWEKKKDYFVVDFNVDKRELEAWYDKTGVCASLSVGLFAIRQILLNLSRRNKR